MISVDETDTWHRKSVAVDVVHRAHAAGPAGATMFRGIEGFGTPGLVHTARFLSLSDELPIVIVDEPERLRAEGGGRVFAGADVTGSVFAGLGAAPLGLSVGLVAG
ncbi:DUF190 domain-containing protein [Yinghuangia seranimata]|uniref:DUF190 domain-containing protein n=1 Tax=Yinghuangia seranimata TaxID=408067 RepID=UPI003CCF2760